MMILKLLMVAATLSVASLDANGQQLASDSQTGANWSPNSEDSWNYWWSYSGISGPTYWGLLNLDWLMCDKGRRQSPINIETRLLVFDPHLSPLQLDSNNLISGILYNDGHAIVFNASAQLYSKQTTKTDSSTIGGGGEHETKNTQPQTNRTRRYLLQDVPSDSSIGSSSNYFDSNNLIRVNDHLSEFEQQQQQRRSSSNDVSARELSQSVELTSKQLDKLTENVQQSVLATSLVDLANLDDRQQQQQPHSSLANGDFSDESAAAAAANFEDEEFAASSRAKVQITGAGLSYSYRFEALYLRFGLDDKQAGSEHLINSRAHAAELQIIAYNSDLYRSFQEASSKPHGLMGIAILVELATSQSSKAAAAAAGQNQQLERLLSRVADIRHRNQLAEVKEFNLSALLPERRQFVAYEGSLTIPGCHESVDWLILNKPLYITQSSLDLLRSISADEQKSDAASGTLIAGNLRPIQAINNRPIRTNIRPSRVNSDNPEACQRLWTRYDYKLGTSQPSDTPTTR